MNESFFYQTVYNKRFLDLHLTSSRNQWVEWHQHQLRPKIEYSELLMYEVFFAQTTRTFSPLPCFPDHWISALVLWPWLFHPSYQRERWCGSLQSNKWPRQHDKGPNQGNVSCYWILKISFKKLLYTQLGSTFVKLKIFALKIQESICKCRI